MGSKGIDFDALCPYWEFFEKGGLNENITKLDKYIKSPVLVIGSGQGIVSKALISAGYNVTSLDQSPLMSSYAKKRRDIETIIDDAFSFKISKTFKTVIVNTGVITQKNIISKKTGDIINNIKLHLDCAGKVLFSYHRHSPFIDAFENLGLLKTPSNNYLFLMTNDIRELKELFVGTGCNRPYIDYVFDTYETYLEKQMDTVLSVGKKYSELHKNASPVDFVKNNTGYSPNHLNIDDEHFLFNEMSKVFNVIQKYAVNTNALSLVLENKNIPNAK